MILHSGLILVGAAFVLISLWAAAWAGVTARKVTGSRAPWFLMGGLIAACCFGAATAELVSAPPGATATFGYMVPARLAPLWFGGGALALLIVGLGLLARVRRTFHGGAKARAGAGVAAQQALLVAGVIVFGIPFLWLVSTSFKEDEDMAHVPPVWIPRVKQYVEQPENDRAAVVVGTYRGTAYTGAAIQEFPNGRRKIRILAPRSLEGTVYTARTGEAVNVRRVGVRWDNYGRALRELPKETLYGALYLLNTLLLVALNIGGTLLSSSLVGYAFARLRFPGRDAMFLLLLATVMLPGAVTMLPVFLVYRSLGWVDTLYPLWVPAFFGGAFNIFLMRQFFLTVPGELDEAARIDGCGYFQTFWRIMLPLVKPALAAVSIWTFTATWNSFMGPLIYINSPEKMPVSYALQLFQSSHGSDPGALMAASVMVMLPVVIVFFLAQKYFIEGVTLTGLGGR